jgi:hypothetical protein
MHQGSQMTSPCWEARPSSRKHNKHMLSPWENFSPSSDFVLHVSEAGHEMPCAGPE